jgi:hypothetical protein
MNSDRFHDPNPPVAGDAEREAVRQRALRIRRRQSIRLVVPVAVLVAAGVAVAIPFAHLRSTPPIVNPATESPSTSLTTFCPSHPESVYNGEGVRFKHPSCWTATSFAEVSSFSDSLVDLSNQPMHDPCTRTTSPSGGGLETECGWPLTSLDPGGILVRWSSDGSPTWRIENQPGTSLTVAGRPAREQITEPGDCGSIGADETISVEVERTVQDNFYEMMACFQGPDLKETASQVQEMIDSTTFKS